MKFLILCSLLATCGLCAPVGQWFEPFGDFLQGELLYPKSSAQNVDLSSIKALFETAIEDEEYLSQSFEKFVARFAKTYSSDEEMEKRKEIFKQNLISVFSHNLKSISGLSSYSQQIGVFADFTTEELLSGLSGHFPRQQYNRSESKAEANKDSWIYDWRSTHVVTPVQNQGGCGACVYFAAAALIETAWARHGHEAVVLSPQQLNDCARDEAHGNHGCEHGGGTFVPTFDYIKARGLTSMQNYPYLAKDANCDKNKESQTVARISSWTPITPHGNEEAMRAVIEKHGPAAVAIHVSDGWTKYRQGVFDEECSGGRNHAVLAVGYGYDGASNKDYWIVKNQWGTGFGDGGYILMRRNHNNMCDISGDAVWVD